MFQNVKYLPVMQGALVMIQKLLFKKRIQLSVLLSVEEENRPLATNKANFVTIMSNYLLNHMIYQLIQTMNGVDNVTAYAI